MKKKLFQFIVASALIVSCTKMSEWTKFDIPYETSVNLDAFPQIDSTFEITSPEIITDISNKLKNSNTNPDLVESVTLKSFEMSMPDSTSANFDFLDHITFYLQTDSLSELKMVSINPVVNGSKKLVFDVSTSDLKPYILSEKIKFKIIVKIDDALQTSSEVKIKSTFTVDAKIFGI